MARIYNQESFEGQFSPSQQSRGFNPVQAADATSKERQRMEQELQDISTQTKSLSRQQDLDTGILRARQTIETANMQARNKAINGLLSLSKTGLQAVGEIQKANEIRAEEDRKLAEIEGFFGNTAEAAEQQKDTATRIQATDTAYEGVATELESTGSVEDADVANTLRNESPGWQFASYQGNVHAATSGFPSYLAERQAASNQTYRTHGEAMNQARQWAGEYARHHGLMTGSRQERLYFANTIGPQLINATAQWAKGQTNARIQADAAQRDSSVAASMAQSASSGVSAAALWDQGIRGYGRGSVGGKKTIDAMIQASINSGNPDLIEEAFNTPKIPDQPNGPKLGDIYYTELTEGLNKARLQRDKMNSERVVQLNTQLYQQLNSPENQDPARRRELIRQTAMQMSRIPGSEKAAQALLDDVKNLDDPTMSAFMVEDLKDRISAGEITDSSIIEKINLGREDKEKVLSYLNENSPSIPDNPEAQKLLESSTKGIVEDIKVALGIKKDRSGNVSYGGSGVDAYGVSQIENAVTVQLARLTKETMSTYRELSPQEQLRKVNEAIREWRKVNVLDPSGKFNLAKQPTGRSYANSKDDTQKREQKIRDLVASPQFLYRTDSTVSSKKNFQSRSFGLSEGVITTEQAADYKPYRNDTIYTQETQQSFSDNYKATGAFSPDLIKSAEAVDLSPLQFLNLQNSAHGLPQVYYSPTTPGLSGPMSPSSANSFFLQSGLSSGGSAYLAEGNSMTPEQGGQFVKMMNQTGLATPFTSPMGTDRQRTSALALMKPNSSTEQQALDVIGRYESDGAGGYDAVNQYGADGGHSTGADQGFYSGPFSGMPQHGGRQLTSMTVGEIMELQHDNGSLTNAQWRDQGRLHAVGRYQFIGDTFKNVINRMGIPRTAVFTPELQDKMALWLLRNSKNGIGQWVGPNTHASPSERDAVNAARTMTI